MTTPAISFPNCLSACPAQPAAFGHVRTCRRAGKPGTGCVRQRALHHLSQREELKGKLNLQPFADDASAADADLLKRIHEVVAAREMPPEDEPQPSDESRKRFLAALSTAIEAAEFGSGGKSARSQAGEIWWIIERCSRSRTFAGRPRLPGCGG